MAVHIYLHENSFDQITAIENANKTVLFVIPDDRFSHFYPSTSVRKSTLTTQTIERQAYWHVWIKHGDFSTCRKCIVGCMAFEEVNNGINDIPLLFWQFRSSWNISEHTFLLHDSWSCSFFFVLMNNIYRENKIPLHAVPLRIGSPTKVDLLLYLRFLVSVVTSVKNDNIKSQIQQAANIIEGDWQKPLSTVSTFTKIIPIYLLFYYVHSKTTIRKGFAFIPNGRISFSLLRMMTFDSILSDTLEQDPNKK